MTFLDFCVNVRNNNPSILPELGKPFKIRYTRETEAMELADALLENTSVTYLELEMEEYTNSFAEAMAKYVRTSKHLQHIRCNRDWHADSRSVLRYREEMFSCFLSAIQESMSLNELHMVLPPRGGPSNLAFESMLTHTQTLRSLSLRIPPRHIDAAAVSSGLKKNTTLLELRLKVSRGATIASLILTSLRDHPLLGRLCLHGYVVDLSGLETLLLSDNSKISELDIHRFNGGPPVMGLPHVLQALARRPTLTKLRLRCCPLERDEARLLRLALCNIPRVQSLVLTDGTLGCAEVAELAPALCHNTSIKVLDISSNGLNDMESADLLRDILFSNNTMTSLNLSGNTFGNMPGAVDCVADGLGNNSKLLDIDLSYCALKDAGVSILAQTLGLRKYATLKKLTLDNNSITSMGFGVLLGTMEQNSHHITDLELQCNPIGNEGARLLATSLGNNTLSNLARLSFSYCDVGDDGFIALVSALEQNTSLLHLGLRNNHGFSERALSTLADTLPKIKVLQRIELTWCPGLASAMPLLLIGLRKNTSLFCFHVAGYATSVVRPTREITAGCAGGIQEMEQLGYRNRFLSLIRAPEERLPPRGVWPRALARVATLPDVIFEVLRSKPNLVLSDDMGIKEVVEDTGVTKKRDE
jgi:hypothetical protein